MTAKQQQAIFSQAFSRHQGAKTPEEFLQALELYRQAASKGSHTFPLHFNMASVYLSLSQMATQQESTSLRQKAADHLDAALTLLPNNLEALVARAAVEDAFARACQPQEILAFRERASTFLRRGADAESKDASVRILLAVG